MNPDAKQDEYRLIIASNRDEHYNRPAWPADKWIEDPNVIGGRDFEKGREGGTWLGASIKNCHERFKLRIAALLNVTGEPKVSSSKGRGFLVTNYLKGEQATPEYVDTFKSDDLLYNGFNFVSVELLRQGVLKAYHYTNVHPCNNLTEYVCDKPVVLGFGNSLLSEPFVKVEAGKAEFEKIVKDLNSVKNKDRLISEIIQLLKWDRRHLPDPVLERRAPDIKEFLSSIFVQVPQAEYGTRTHTVILVDWQGNLDYIEETMVNHNWENNHIRTFLGYC